jgi:hypothetical protein
MGFRKQMSVSMVSEFEAAFAALTSTGDVFSGSDVIAASGVAVESYTEKQFVGEQFADSDWAAI